jgi:23S rRNA (adenine2030-N6)-methyltransferase
LNYRHAFHAGNFADVHKHLILLALIERLQRKPTAFFYLDTHAGRGYYDLKSEEARRSNEWREGIGRLRDVAVTSADIKRYLAGIKKVSQQSAHHYPGSPLLALDALRDIDRAALVEQLHEEARVLEREVRHFRRVTVVEGDGYDSLKTYLPPRERRGLVLIDPPYESDREFKTVQQALQSGLERWPTGMFALWYPLKAGPETLRMQVALKASGLRRLLVLELSVRPADSPLSLNGSGMLIANPPWQFDAEMRTSLGELHRLLAPRGAGGVRVEWLVGE